MTAAITSFWTASALGVGNAETLANLQRGRAPGMREIGGDIPGRTIFFGGIDAALPTIAEKKWNMRACRLLKLAVESLGPELDAVRARVAPDRLGIVLGASNTGIDEAQACVDAWIDTGAKPDALDFSMIELGTPALYLKELLGTTGPAYTVSTACSSAAKAFGAARRLLARGVCDAVVTGGVDGRCRFAMNGFHALGALAQGRCRPLAPDRDGINLGEAVALFVLERTGAGVRVRGVGESSDAYHATAPDPEGAGAEASMRAALADAALAPADIDYVNLHGTGTPANDAMEMKAVARVFAGLPQLPRCESTKSLTGHCLGAAGAVEAAICALLIQSGACRAALSNSFAFGGSNASLVLSA